MAASPKKAKATPANGGEAVELSAGSVRAIAEAVAEKLVEIGPKLARLAAADTIHSVEHFETVLSRALKEGEVARQLIVERAACQGSGDM